MVANTWASLPCDLLVDIFSRLDTTALAGSAGACRPWRRAIIGNASSLGPRPALLLGFFHDFSYVHHRARRPFADVLAAPTVDWTSYTALFRACSPAAPLFVPDGLDIGMALYRYPLSSRAGFVLLGAGFMAADLCLCNPMASDSCRLLPAATLDMSTAMAAGAPAYVLVTGHDVACTDRSSNDDGSAVWILAVNYRENVGSDRGMAYQIFSSASGEWGPAKRSARLMEGTNQAHKYGEPKDAVVCRGGAVYWLAASIGIGIVQRAFAFAIDVRTERTWTTALPEKYAVLHYHWPSFSSLSLATSGDGGELSLVVSLPLPSMQIEVWLLAGDGGRWTLRRTIDVPELIPDHCRIAGRAWLRTCCYSSGFLFVDVDERDLLIAVDEELPCPIQQIVRRRVSCYPYEMDWLTYASKMKYF